MAEEKTVTVDLNVVKGLLTKMGASYTDDISEDRAVKKLIRYVHKDGIPEEYTPEEAEVLVTLGLAEVEPEEGPEEKEKDMVKEEKEEDMPKEEKEKKAPKEKKALRPDWMTVATHAILSSKKMSEAGVKAAKNYVKEGGKETKGNEQNGKLYVSFASKVLIAINSITVEDDKITKA